MSCDAAARLQVVSHEGVAGIEEAVPVLLSVLDGAVVLGASDGAIDWDDHPFSQDLVDGLVVEVAPVVALDEQGSAVFAEEFFEVVGNLFTTGHVAGQGLHLVPVPTAPTLYPVPT